MSLWTWYLWGKLLRRQNPLEKSPNNINSVMSALARKNGATHMFTKLYYHHMGTMMEPHYRIMLADDGKYYYQMLSFHEGGDLLSQFADAEFRDMVDTKKQRKKCVVMSAEDVNLIANALAEHNAPSWDGFQERKSPGPFVLDGDDSFSFRLEYSDGTTVKASGSHARPKGFSEFIEVFLEFTYRQE